MRPLPTEDPWPPGELRRIYLHWTADDYTKIFSAYHFCIGLDGAGRPAVFATHSLQANMRELLGAAPGTYAAHTAGRNSYAIGLAICGMRGATPQAFGQYPLREDLIELGCATVARLCAFYAIALDEHHVRTHAEAALEDGYYGAGPDERWDIARLEPSPRPLDEGEARRTGDLLRARAREQAASLRSLR